MGTVLSAQGRRNPLGDPPFMLLTYGCLGVALLVFYLELVPATAFHRSR